MSFSIKRVRTSAEKNQFIRLPWKIYDSLPYWVPPLVSERKKFLNPKINPFFKESEVDLFLVISEERIPVGRIALTANHVHNKMYSEQVGFFGMFESINDDRVSDLLFKEAESWCRNKRLDRLLGPISLSTNHECGLLVDGFDELPVIGIPYNPPYYMNLLKNLGFVKLKDLLSLRLDLIHIPEYLESSVSRLRKRDRFLVRPMLLNEFDKELNNIWEVYNSSWMANWGFLPMSREEFEYSANEMRSFIKPEFCFIAEVKGEVAGFSLTLPNINEVLKGMNGGIFPFGWAKFLLGKSNIKTYRVVALGVKKQYRRLGIDAVLYYETYKKFLEKKIKWCDMSWVLEDNKHMLIPIKRIGGTIYKRHRIYEWNILS